MIIIVRLQDVFFVSHTWDKCTTYVRQLSHINETLVSHLWDDKDNPSFQLSKLLYVQNKCM